MNRRAEDDVAETIAAGDCVTAHFAWLGSVPSSSGIGLRHDSPLLEALRDVAKTFSRPVVAETE